MSEVLFLAHRVPFPPDRGDRIRSSHLLRRIAEAATVHFGCLIEDEADKAALPAIEALCASHHCAARPPIGRAGIVALARRQPVSVAAFDAPSLHAWVRDTLKTRPISAIFVFSGQMAPYVPDDFAGRVVMDFVDVDSAKYEAYAAAAGQPRRWLYAREDRLLRALEESAARRADLSLFVSAEERDLFSARLRSHDGIALAALGNGIDAAAFDPSGIASTPELADGGPHLVFTGQMDYPPNVEAVTLFARQVFPRVRALYPNARFAIVGRAPTATVQALGALPGVLVTGAVPDVRPWLAGADLVVAPLAIARGVQNKVLEAMAMARPVLLTSGAATGIAARDGEHFAVADGAHAFGTRALALLGQAQARRAMGCAARDFVLAHHAWDSVLAPLPAMLGLAA